MTALATEVGSRTGPGTSAAPTGRTLWRRGRAPLAGVLVLVLLGLGAAALRSTGSGGALDPASYAPKGSRALAALLRDRGVDVRTVGDLGAVRAGLGPRTTVLVPRPAALTPAELDALGRLDAPLVVVGAGQAELDALRLAVSAEPATTAVRQPGCDLPVASVAGSARAGGTSYASDGVPSVGCYAAGGRATLLAVPGSVDGAAGGTTLLGSADPLTNERLATEGDAALAVGLVGDSDTVLWLLPRAGRAVPGGKATLGDLLPDAVGLAALQLVVAVVLLALWRARRLGRVVTEPLPVVVRAAETVEGRGRLYRRAGARGTASAALRAGARDTLARRLGLSPDGGGPALVEAVARRTGRPPVEVEALLYGAPPADDAALVRLADALDALSA